ncbi:hypothetical protein D7242_11815 [Legionella pneumophila]|nr:hypothetical protein BIZ52_03665 [Legionella pneumophila subsp. fraseri]RYB34633.1 hypothetical protein D7242_11815 [Legionella pneumophila]
MDIPHGLLTDSPGNIQHAMFTKWQKFPKKIIDNTEKFYYLIHLSPLFTVSKNIQDKKSLIFQCIIFFIAILKQLYRIHIHW